MPVLLEPNEQTTEAIVLTVLMDGIPRGDEGQCDCAGAEAGRMTSS